MILLHYWQGFLFVCHQLPLIYTPLCDLNTAPEVNGYKTAAYISVSICIFRQTLFLRAKFPPVIRNKSGKK